MKTLHQLHTENKEIEIKRVRTTYTGHDKITKPCTIVITALNGIDFELTNYVDGCPRSITLTYDSLDQIEEALSDYEYMEQKAIKRNQGGAK